MADRSGGEREVEVVLSQRGKKDRVVVVNMPKGILEGEKNGKV